MAERPRHVKEVNSTRNKQPDYPYSGEHKDEDKEEEDLAWLKPLKESQAQSEVRAQSSQSPVETQAQTQEQEQEQANAQAQEQALQAQPEVRAQSQTQAETQAQTQEEEQANAQAREQALQAQPEVRTLSQSQAETQAQTQEQEQENTQEQVREALYWQYETLYRAALSGKWDARMSNVDARKAKITNLGETALHVAVTVGAKSINFVEKLVGSITNIETESVLKLTDDEGYTVLHSAAWFGNTPAARILVRKYPNLLYICVEQENWLPVHRAAAGGHRGTLLYLLNKMESDASASGGGVGGNPRTLFANQSGVELLLLLISSGFYDVASRLVRQHPTMATTALADGRCALGEMAKKVSAFRSCNRLNFWQSFIYYCIPVKLKDHVEVQHHNGGDLENQISCSQTAHNRTQFSGENFFISVLPYVKDIQEQKLMHHHARQLVKFLCAKIKSKRNLETYRSFAKVPFLMAARLGISEIVEEVLYSFPRVIGATDDDRNIFEHAVILRQENIFNLLYDIGGYKQSMMRSVDEFGNNILHLAGELAPPNKLNLVSGAALQMQRELQWFKEVEKFVTPSCIDSLNNDGKTPAMVFSKAHEELVKEGERWMRDTATSCTVVAALIVTVVFAAAITVPGGNDGTNGLPMFSKEKAFTIFAISDAISLFTSVTSLLMFLSILTSRYAEGDFLYVLPRRLIFGLLSLFLSITTMTIAFTSTLYLVFGHLSLYLVFGHRKVSILFPVAALAFLPIASFVFLQFPLLVRLVSSTYGRGIFGRK